MINLWNQSFSLEFHADERKKVRFILENTQDFMHPTLLLQTARIVNYFLKFKEREDIAQLGRTISALAGVLIVFISYLFGKKYIGPKCKYILAISVALSPIMVIHSHYLKEDMIFTAFFLLSLYRLFAFVEKPNLKNILFLSFASGCAISAKYIACILIPIFLITPVFYKSKLKKEIYKGLVKSLIYCFIIFVIINYPLINDFKTFLKGFSYEINHVINGHETAGYATNGIKSSLIKITPLDFWFGFHLRYSLIYGMTLPIVILCLFGLIVSLFNWKKLKEVEKVLFIATTGIYFISEISPTKPFPDFMRYMIPIVPMLLYFLVLAFRFINYNIIKKTYFAFAACSISYSALDTFLLVHHLKKDTRNEAIAWLKESKANVKGEMYTMTENRVVSITFLDINQEREQGVDFLVASSFYYDRILVAKKLKHCPHHVASAYEQYNYLFKLPCIEFKPKHRSFAFSNPTIRIIDIHALNDQSLCTKNIEFRNLIKSNQGTQQWEKTSPKS
jgi:predicted membrane-bound mannosyltransferase